MMPIRRRPPVRPTRLAAALALALALACAGTAPAAAQVPPHENWQTLRTDRFRITFSPGLEALARHAAERAEAAYAQLARELGPPPRGTIDVLITADADIANGFAMPFPSNRIVVYATPPVDDLGLAYTRDWVELVIAHELVHIFQMDRAGLLGRVARGVFGRVPFGWPLFPVIGTPQWSIEGLATYYESRLTGLGRAHGALHEMMLRTAVLEGRFESIDQASGFGPQWPTGLRPYVYGSMFLDHLARRHGPEVMREIVGRTAGAVIPPTLAFDRIGRKATGESFTAEWRAWRRELETRYARLADSLRAEGLTEAESLTPGGYFTLYPRVAADGRVAFAAVDGRSASATRVLDPETGAVRTLARRNGGGPSAWLQDGSLLIAQLELEDQYRMVYDLYRIGRDGTEHRLTRGARLSEPDIAPDGRRVVAVQRGEGGTRLVVYDLETGALRALAPEDPAAEWSLPRWSPDGARIAAGRWLPGGEYDVVVLDTLGRVQRALTRDRAMDIAPAWSPDGRYVLFSSDRSGIPNLYAYDLAAGDDAAALRQVTSVLSGAFYPDVSPDGRWIYFTGYHADGYHIERIPFDTAAWRSPAPRVLAFAAEDGAAILPQPGARGGEGQGGNVRGYSALPTLLPRAWLPVAYDDGVPGFFLGAGTYGADLVGRHAYSASLAVAVNRDEPRLAGGLSYSWAGLGNPVLGLAAFREWDHAGFVLMPDSTLGDVVSREDVVSLSATVLRRRWRTAASLTLGAEFVDERFSIEDAPGLRLTDDHDRLVGAFARASFGNARLYPFSISREDGVSLTLSARRRWDTDPSDVADRSYNEATAWGAAYKAIPAFGFANHVLALRASAVWRDGPGASLVDIGGASGTALDLGVGTVGGPSLFLPVRGFRDEIRHGTRAWSASLEYRLPIALIGRGSRLLPFYLDRLSGALFADAGRAWCTPAEERRSPACALAGQDDTPLLSAGGEIALDLSLFFGTPFRIRGGVAAPLRGPADDPVFYVRIGPSF